MCISLTNLWLSLAVLFALNFFFFTALFAMWPQPLPTFEGVASMPWWAPLAGLTGAVAVALIDKLGAGMVNGLIIAANVATSLAIDHLSLMNAPMHGVNLWRLLGAVLMAAGVTLICRFRSLRPAPVRGRSSRRHLCDLAPKRVSHS